MSKSSRANSKIKRLNEKRKRKAAQKAKYATFAASGNNGASKRNRLKSKRKGSLRLVRHASGPCGNIGCGRCNPAPYNQVSRSGSPRPPRKIDPAFVF